MIRLAKDSETARLIRRRGVIRSRDTSDNGLLPHAIRTQLDVAAIMTVRGIPMTTNHVRNTEQSALKKLRRLLGPLLTEWEETA